MGVCKGVCDKSESTPMHFVYQTGGCYCTKCDYYFKEKFLQCPCCGTRVRYSTRSNRRKLESDTVRI